MLIHQLNRIFVKDVVGIDLLSDQIGLVLAELFFVTVSLVTRHLFVAVGLHAFMNEPAPIVQISESTAQMVWISMVLVVVVPGVPVRRLICGQSRRQEVEVRQ